ncbi:unnamed protein product [Tilletia caries]|nr:unnamed protein product [Tilletia caries]CAD6942670.1 unnamed protein product [Tilletia caries]
MASASAVSGIDGGELHPRSGAVGSGNNNAFDFGDALGIFGGDDKGFSKGSGGGRLFNDDSKGNKKGGIDHSKGQGQDSHHKDAGVKKFKKEKQHGSGKADFGGFDRGDDFGFREGLDFGEHFGNNFGGRRGGFEGGRYGGLEDSIDTFSGSSSTSGFRGGNFFGARSFDGGKGGSGSRHKKEKVEKVEAKIDKNKKHEAAAEVNADAKFSAAAAHRTFHRNALLAKKIAAEKKKGGFSWFF